MISQQKPADAIVIYTSALKDIREKDEIQIQTAADLFSLQGRLGAVRHF